MTASTNSIIQYVAFTAANAYKFNSNESFILGNMLRFGVDGAVITNQYNHKLDLFASDTASSKTNMVYDSSADTYVYTQVDDEIDDSDYTDHWTAANAGVGAVSETADYLQATSVVASGPSTSTSNAESDGGSGTAIDYDTGSDLYIQARIEMHYSRDADATVTSRWGLTDGSATVWLKTEQFSGGNSVESLTNDSVWGIYIDAAGDTADIYDDGVLDTASIDISSLSGGQYYFVIEGNSSVAGGTAGTGRTRLYYLYSLGVGYTSGVLITGTKTLTNEDALISVSGATVNDGVTITREFSGNGGSNYDTVIDSVRGAITIPGTTGQMRFTFTAPTSITPGTSPLTSLVSYYTYYYG